MDPIAKAARWPITILLTVLIFVFVILGVRSEVNSRAIAANTDRLENSVYLMCTESQRSANGVNSVLDSLIKVNQAVTGVPKPEINARIALYRSVKMSIPVCTKP